MIKYKINILEALKNKSYTAYKLRKDNILGEAIIQNFRKNEVVNINSKTINTLCTLLNCQPGDILEYVPDNQDNI